MDDTARIMVIRDGRADPDLYHAKRSHAGATGEVYEWYVHRTYHSCEVPTGTQAVRWRNHRLIIVLDGDVLACDWKRSRYGEEIVPILTRGAAVRRAFDQLQMSLFDWRLIGIIAIVAVAGFILYQIVTQQGA